MRAELVVSVALFFGAALLLAPAFMRRVVVLAANDRATSSLLAAFAASPSIEEFRLRLEAELPRCALADVALAGVQALHRHDLVDVLELATQRARRTWRPRLVAGVEVLELLAFAAPLVGLVIAALAGVDQVLARVPILAGAAAGAIAFTLRALLFRQVEAHFADVEAFAVRLAETIERCKRESTHV